MKDGIYEHLQKALYLWNEKLGEVWQLLSTSPQNFKGGALWAVVQSINATMQSIGIGLLVLFFAWGVLHSTTNLGELRRPEPAIKLFLRFVIAKGLVTYGMELMLAIMQICQGILSRIMPAHGSVAEFVVPSAIEEAIESVTLTQSLLLWVVTLGGSIFVTVESFILLFEVYSKFFKFYLFTAFSPIPLSTFAGETAQNSGKQFLRNYAAVCLEFASVALACVIASKLMTTPLVDATASAINQVWGYIIEVAFNIFVLVATVKMTDRLTRELVGL